MNLPITSFNESAESKGGDSMENKTYQERAFSSFASASKKFHMSNVLVIEKLCIIVRKYFESKPLLRKYSEEIDILIQYNKKLIEVLSKFEDQEARLITRLKRLQEMHLEYMRVYQLNKGKQVAIPNAHTYQSIFADFSLTKLKFESRSFEPPEVEEPYKQRLVKILKKHYIHPQYEMEKIIEENLTKAVENSPQEIKLREILRQICAFNRQVENFNEQKIFDLVKLRLEIRKNLDDYFQDTNAAEFKPDDKAEEKFINDVVKLHADLEQMDQPLLMTFLKEQKQIRQKLEKEKMKLLKVYQQQFGRLEIEHTFQKQQLATVKIQKIQLEREFKDYKNKIQIKKLKSRGSSRSRMVDQSKIDLSTSRLGPTFEKDGQVEALQKKLLKKMEEIDELKKNKADNEMLTKQLRNLMQENEFMRREIKKLEAIRSSEKSVIKDRSELISEIKELKQRSQILQKMDQDQKPNNSSLSINEAKISRLHPQNKVLGVSFGQQTSQSLIHFHEIRSNQSRIQIQIGEKSEIKGLPKPITTDAAVQTDREAEEKPAAQRQERSEKTITEKAKDESVILSPNMPQIKDIELLWNNYDIGSMKEEEISRIPLVRHDQSFEAGLQNTIKMLEARIQEYEKMSKRYEDIIDKKNEQFVRRQRDHTKEIQKLNQNNRSMYLRLDGLEKKQGIVEHMAVAAYNTVGLLSKLNNNNGPAVANKIKELSLQFEKFMEEYQIQFQKNIIKEKPGFFTDLSVQICSKTSEKTGRRSLLKKALSVEDSNLDIMKDVIQKIQRNQRIKHEKPVREETKKSISSSQKVPSQVYFDSSRRRSSNQQIQEEFKLELSREDSKNPSSLIRIPKMKESQELLEYSQSRHLESKKSFYDSNSRKLKEQYQDIKSVNIEDIDEIPKPKTPKSQFANVNFEARQSEEKQQKRPNPLDNVIFKEVFKKKFIKSDPEDQYLELFQNHQIALKSLEEQQKKNKRRDLQFQDYISALFNSKKPAKYTLSLEQKLFGLQKLVKQQQTIIEEQRREYGKMFKVTHKQFQNDLQMQLRELRNNSMTL